MQEFKSPVSRLARLFHKGRDNWREKALEKQTKMRSLEVKIRDLSNSRENWKSRALAAEKKLKSLELEGISEKKKQIQTRKDNAEAEAAEINIKHHHYDAQTIEQALKMLIDCGISLRGAGKVFQLFNPDELSTTPSFTGIRKWLGRIGIYELKRENEYRDDWIFIVDFTVELGKQKALVILGISQKYFQNEVISKNRSLSHKDVEVLGLEIMDSTTGELIEQQLDKISKKVGIPVQIVADNGSDLAKGIKLYQDKYPDLIYTHDVTHAMALLLKKQLNSDDRYQSFLKECNLCRQKLQQTELSFLAPPSQRSQCRYFNVERLTEWGINILNSSPETLMILMPDSDHSLVINKIVDKLGWLTGYKLELTQWNQMVLLTRQIETHLKQSGINNQSPTHFLKEQVIFDDTSLNNFQQHVFDYLTFQSAKFKNTDIFLATSDVIESLFGKYKQFSVRCPFKEMGLMILTIYLSTMDLTTNLIKDALEAISFVEVEDWLAEVFGCSTLSKRKTLFSIA